MSSRCQGQGVPPHGGPRSADEASAVNAANGGMLNTFSGAITSNTGGHVSINPQVFNNHGQPVAIQEPAVEPPTEDQPFDAVPRLVVSIRKPKRRTQPRPDAYLVSNADVLIVNNDFFDDPAKDRTGSGLDVKNLKNLFRQAGYRVRIETDLTGEQMLQVSEQFATSDHATSDLIVVVIMSHGNEGVIEGVDGELVPSAEILQLFAGDNLADVPKVFIFAHCRGEKRLREKVTDDVDINLRNSFIIYTTRRDYAALRDPLGGTWFVRSFCQVMMEQMASEGLEKIMEEVKADLEKGRINGYIKERQVPEWLNQLSKKDITFKIDP